MSGLKCNAQRCSVSSWLMPSVRCQEMRWRALRNAVGVSPSLVFRIVEYTA
jgi:hypothetical protein